MLAPGPTHPPPGGFAKPVATDSLAPFLRACCVRHEVTASSLQPSDARPLAGRRGDSSAPERGHAALAASVTGRCRRRPRQTRRPLPGSLSVADPILRFPLGAVGRPQGASRGGGGNPRPAPSRRYSLVGTAGADRRAGERDALGPLP